MAEPGPIFEIVERRQGNRTWLHLRGELDIATAPALTAKLEQARDERRSVLLDISELQFMDSSGLRVLLAARMDADVDGWSVEINGELPGHIATLFDISGVRKLLVTSTG